MDQKDGARKVDESRPTERVMCTHSMHLTWFGEPLLLPPDEFYPRTTKCKKCYIRQQSDIRRNRGTASHANDSATSVPPQVFSLIPIAPASYAPAPPAESQAPLYGPPFQTGSSTEGASVAYYPLAPVWANYSQASPQPSALADGSVPPDSFPAPNFLAHSALGHAQTDCKPSCDKAPLERHLGAVYASTADLLRRLCDVVAHPGSDIEQAVQYGQAQATLRAIQDKLKQKIYSQVAEIAPEMEFFWPAVLPAVRPFSPLEKRLVDLKAEFAEWEARHAEMARLAVATGEPCTPPPQFAKAERCAVCGGASQLAQCSGACRRVFHPWCMPNTQTIESYLQCDDCVRGRPVVHYDSTRGEYFTYGFADATAEPRDPTSARQEAAKTLSALPAEDKLRLRTDDEAQRLAQMFYDPLWCCWRPKDRSVVAARIERRRTRPHEEPSGAAATQPTTYGVTAPLEPAIPVQQ